MDFVEGLDIELLLAEKMAGKTKFDFKVMQFLPIIHIHATLWVRILLKSFMFGTSPCAEHRRGFFY